MPFDWDTVQTDNTYVKFENKGDSVAGVITDVEMRSDFNGDPAPALYIETSDGEKIVTAGQVNLKRALKEKGPQEGDSIKIVYTGLNGKAKQFEVTVTKGDGQPAANKASKQDDLEAPF